MSRDLFSRILLLISLLAIVVIGADYFSAQSDNFAGTKVWFLDVGQGDAELINTPNNQQILIDGGPDEKVLSGLSKAMDFNDKYIDLIVISHYHSDHLTGVNSVLNHYQVGEIWVSGAVYDSATYRKFVELAASKNVRVTNVVADSYRNFGEVKSTVLTPFTSFAGKAITDAHEAMVVTKWQYKNQTIMLMGDAETDIEQALISRGVLNKITILKVGHHGSSTSSSEAFLSIIRPEYAAIEVGKANKYGHPTDTTLQKLKTIGAKILRTDQDGTIRFNLDGTNATYSVNQ